MFSNKYASRTNINYFVSIFIKTKRILKVNLTYRQCYLRFDNEAKKLDKMLDSKPNDEDKLYDVHVSTTVPKSDIKDDTEISCILKVPGTDYLKKREVTYDGMNIILCIK